MTTDFLCCFNINERYSSEETERKAKKDDQLVYLVMERNSRKLSDHTKKKRERNSVIRRLDIFTVRRKKARLRVKLKYGLHP